jgi:hypothetical protein
MRSRSPISEADLTRLAEIAAADLADLFERKPHLGRLHRDRVLCVALCQGAALHYLDGRTGVKDFDVWTFFSESPGRPFPFRRRAQRAFGPPEGPVSQSFIGKRVDLMGRTLPEPRDADPLQAMRRYLGAGRTRSAQLLARKAVVLLAPVELRGTVAWPSG